MLRRWEVGGWRNRDVTDDHLRGVEPTKSECIDEFRVARSALFEVDGFAGVLR